MTQRIGIATYPLVPSRGEKKEKDLRKNKYRKYLK